MHDMYVTLLKRDDFYVVFFFKFRFEKGNPTKTSERKGEPHALQINS